MNDEASSSAAAQASSQNASQSHETAPTAAELSERRKKNRQMFNRKRGDLLDDLLRNLDILIYAELSIIYYMDCSFIRFILRAFMQFWFLTPKPAIFPIEAEDRPVLGGLAISNSICLICHIWFNPPSAGEATRGYLHGGSAIDFIGQKGPSSKMHLVALDVLVIVLQLVHLAVTMVRRRLKERTAPSTAAQPITASHGSQDADAEERGVRRSQDEQDIEMQTLNPSGTVAGTEQTAESSEQDALLATTVPKNDSHVFDAFHSGQIVLADLDLWKSVKEQAHILKSAQHGPTPSVESVRNELAARVLRMRMGTDAIRQTL